jgi:thiamine pyrophosphate-dependent acetolactate synthase large subunit-like protein
MINRQELARDLVGSLTGQLLVTGLGNSSFDIYAAGDRPENFYTRGSLGLGPSVAFGLARGRPDDQVICVDGEGAVLMNLGALSTIGRYAPTNLICVILDNQAYQITGGQPTHTGAGTDLAMVARGCGIESTATVESLDAFTPTFKRFLGEPGPHVLVAKVDQSRAGGYQPRKPPLIKYRFMGKIGTMPDVAALAW